MSHIARIAPSGLYAIVEGMRCLVARGEPGDNVFEVHQPIDVGSGIPSFRWRILASAHVEGLVEVATRALVDGAWVDVVGIQDSAGRRIPGSVPRDAELLAVCRDAAGSFRSIPLTHLVGVTEETGAKPSDEAAAASGPPPTDDEAMLRALRGAVLAVLFARIAQLAGRERAEVQPPLRETSGLTARYTQDGIRLLVRRSWREAVGMIALAIVFFGIGIAIELAPVVLIALFVIVALPTVGAIRRAVQSPGYWSADGALAIAVDESGVTIPHLGTLPWSRIAGVELHTGRRANRVATGPRIRVHYRGDAARVRRMSGDARHTFAGTRRDGTFSHDAAFAAAMEVDAFADAVAAVSAAAAAREIPVL